MGLFEDGNLLSETDLVASLGTSRNAVREALSHLRDEGVVTRQPRVGTVVAVDPILLAPTSWVGQRSAAADVGPEFLTTQTERVEVPADAFLRLRLELEGDRCFLSETLLLTDDSPVALRLAYYPSEEAADRFVQRLQKGEDVFEGVEGSISAGACDSRSAHALGIRTGAPVLLREILFREADGTPSCLTLACLRGDRISISF